MLAPVLDNINKTNVEKDTSAYYMYDSIHIQKLATLTKTTKFKTSGIHTTHIDLLYLREIRTILPFQYLSVYQKWKMDIQGRRKKRRNK